MDKVALVSFDIENGRKVVDALDHDGKSPNVALWAKLPEYEDWRLVLASNNLDQAGSLTAYGQINEAIRKAGIPLSKRPTISVRQMDKPFIKALRNIFAHAADTYGMRLGGQTFGDQYLEDAFVYRIK
jgi:hypothetical protein